MKRSNFNLMICMARGGVQRGDGRQRGMGGNGGWEAKGMEGGCWKQVMGGGGGVLAFPKGRVRIAEMFITWGRRCIGF